MKPNYQTLQVLKTADPKLRKALISKCNKEIVNCIIERSERQYKAECLLHKQATKTQGGASQRIQQAHASLQEEKLIVQRGGILLPRFSAVFPTPPSLILGNHVTLDVPYPCRSIAWLPIHVTGTDGFQM